MDKFIEFFERFARRASAYAGKPLTFVVAVLLIVVWAVVGPVFDFSDTWQLVINTGTTIITFLMIFLVQSAQNRDARALQLKLDELIFKMGRANNLMIDIEELSEREQEELARRYKNLRDKHLNGQKKKKPGNLKELSKNLDSPKSSKKRGTGTS